MIRKSIVFNTVSILLVSLLVSACLYEKDPDPNACIAPFELELLSKTPASSCTAADGEIVVDIISGVDESTEFRIGNGSFTNSSTFNNLSGGTYVIEARNDKGCKASLTVELHNLASNLSIASIARQPSGCETENGSLTVEASGSGTIMYKLNGGSYQTQSTFSGLAQGNYTVTVKDDSGCEYSQSVTVLSGVSFEQEISPIIQANCAIPTCHDGSTAQPNFNNFSTAQANATGIKLRTQNGSMPKGNRSITQQEIDLIACWVDDGALNN